MAIPIPIFEAEDFEEPKNSNLIGQGGFGLVHKLKMEKDHQTYAVKIFKGQDSNDLRDNILSEAKVISRLNYPTLLKFHGITFKYPYYLITDYIPNHSVEYFINKAYQGQTNEEWNNTNKFIIILGICLGMIYIHSNNIVHLDLKPGNILLENNFYPKICDFNLSKTISTSQKCKTFVGTIEYCAPEVLDSTTEEEYDGKKQMFIHLE